MEITKLQTIIADAQNKQLPELTKRSLPVTPVGNMSFAIVGARRCGKTFRTYQYMQELYSKGVSPKNICRVQFNDHRLQKLLAEELDVIDQAYFSLFPEKRGREDVYFIFDEIHRVEGWEDYVLYLLEQPRCSVLITGSTSKLLTGEIASALRGKNFSRELTPFSFLEFVRHYGVESDIVSSQGRASLLKLLQRYIEQGGFPGLLDLDVRLHHELLTSYWDTMILRDIIEAHPEDNISIVSFTRFLYALLARISCPVTINRIATNLKQEGVKFSSETLYKYMHYLQQAYLLFPVEFFSSSEKVRGQNYRKIYAVDWALADAVVPAEGVHPTRQFENMVYLELRRRGYGVSYYRTRQGYEINFVATDRKGTAGSGRHLFQVCYSLSDPDVRERELRALGKAASHLEAESCRVITLNSEEILEYDGVEIKIEPAWKWLLC